MPRAPRVFVEGGIYHAYNRVTRGERVFADHGEADRLVDVMRKVKQRDGLIVLAWCVMSNHYHLAVRCTSVPFIDELGRSTALERPRLEVVDFIGGALGVLAVDVEEVAGRTKRPDVVRARELILTLGVARYGLRVKDLAAALGVRYDTASLWGRRGARRRCDDGGFGRQMNELETALAAAVPSRTVTSGEHGESPNV